MTSQRRFFVDLPKTLILIAIVGIVIAACIDRDRASSASSVPVSKSALEQLKPETVRASGYLPFGGAGSSASCFT